MSKKQRGNQANKSWFSIKAMATGHAEIIIYDEIGYWGKNAADFIRELNALTDVSEITLRINSPGGDVFDGNAIYNLLRGHPAKVTAHIDGVAASIASLIAMAADEIVMPDNAMMMIHDPFAGVSGDANDLRKAAEVLDKLRNGLLSAYMAKTGADETTVSAWMSNETWFTATEASDAGLADTVIEPVKAAASFDLSQFNHAPEGFGMATQNLMAPVNSALKKIGENAMTIEQLKAQLQATGDKKIALEAKLATAEASLTDAQAKLEESKDMIAAGKAYKAKLVDQVIQARRSLKMMGDKPEDVQTASAFVESWPLAHIEAEAKQLSTLVIKPSASGITGDSTDSEDQGDKPTSFRNQKEA